MTTILPIDSNISELLENADKAINNLNELKNRTKNLSNWQDIHTRLNIENGMKFAVKENIAEEDLNSMILSRGDQFKVENGYLIKTSTRNELINDYDLSNISKEFFQKIFECILKSI